MGRKNHLTLVFWLFMAIVVLIAVIMLTEFARMESDSRQLGRESVISEMGEVLPELTHRQAERLRDTLKSWEELRKEETLFPTLLRDLGIALIIAVFLTVTVESYAGRRLRAQAAEDVLAGVFNKIIPETIFEEIRTHVIQAGVLRTGWEIRMGLRKDATLSKRDPNLYISNTRFTYCVNSLLKKRQDIPISAGLAQDINGVDAKGNSLPRFMKVTIGNTVLSGRDLERCLSRDGTVFDYRYPLKSDKTEVLIEVEEIVRTPDAFYWCTPMPADGIKIFIDSNAAPELQFTALAYHPNRDALSEPIKGENWVFPCGILPWQGFEICAKKVSHNVPVSAQVADKPGQSGMPS